MFVNGGFWRYYFTSCFMAGLSSVFPVCSLKLHHCLCSFPSSNYFDRSQLCLWLRPRVYLKSGSSPCFCANYSACLCPCFFSVFVCRKLVLLGQFLFCLVWGFWTDFCFPRLNAPINVVKNCVFCLLSQFQLPNTNKRSLMCREKTRQVQLAVEKNFLAQVGPPHSMCLGILPNYPVSSISPLSDSVRRAKQGRMEKFSQELYFPQKQRETA